MWLSSNINNSACDEQKGFNSVSNLERRRNESAIKISNRREEARGILIRYQKNLHDGNTEIQGIQVKQKKNILRMASLVIQ